MDLRTRFKHAEEVAEEYTNFVDFAVDGMLFLGFPLTEIQEDIALFMATGPQLRMVMAQRGEAKSTLAALYAVWRLIHKPTCRVLVVSAGEDQASDVATLIVRIIMRWEILEFMRPEKSEGDKTSTDAFDIYWALRGTVDKSPSVACVGITSNLPGRRADLLIADDVESTKNSYTVTQRSHLLLLTKEFSSICSDGDILYLGTPQTKDSIYNTLPGRGYVVRIWPGRYPNPEELDKYGERLAPLLAERLRSDSSLQRGGGIDGTRGKPTDPARFNDEKLNQKELEQGPENFQLQFMLDTSMLDAMREQLQLSDLVIANFDWEQVPEVIPYQADASRLVPVPADFPIHMPKMYYPANTVGVRFGKLENKMMYVDPAGGGVDEIGFACSGALGPYIHVLTVGGLRGGLTDDNADTLIDTAVKYGITTIKCESNMGAGLFEINLRGRLAKRGLTHIGVIGDWAKGQKERRIINRLVSAFKRHRVIFHKDVFADDSKYCKQHSIDKRNGYSVFFQLTNITTDRDSLQHDDRIEALAGAVEYHKQVLVQDEETAAKQRSAAQAAEFMANPMGYPVTQTKKKVGAFGTIMQRWNR